MRPNDNAWRLELGDRFELRDASGNPVPLAYRKVEELLAILAFAPGRSLSRSEIGQALWPTADNERRRASVRQAICKLRLALGEGSVLFERDGYRLAESFEIVCDEDAERFNRIPISTVQESHGNPIESFYSLLNWYADRDPVQALDLMRSNQDLTTGIWPGDLSALVQRLAKRQHSLRRLSGWIPYWQGIEMCIQNDIPGARIYLRAAAEAGLAEGDQHLVVEAIGWAVSCEILLKRLDAATKLANYGQQIAYRTKDRFLISRIEHMRGTILIHRARTDEGLHALSESADGLGDRILEVAQTQALRGLYLACAGRSKEAQQTLEGPQQVLKETRHFRLESISELADGYILISEGEYEAAGKWLDQFSTKAKVARSLHFLIYAKEAIASAHWLSGEKPEAIRQLGRASKLRRCISMAYTDWDRLRMRAIDGAA